MLSLLLPITLQAIQPGKAAPNVAIPRVKSLALASRCTNMSETSAKAFDLAYKRGWSGGQKNRDSARAYSNQDVAYYYRNPTDRESASGAGSNLGPPTAGSLRILSETIEKHNVQTMVDVPCGDVNWQFGEWAMDSLRGYVGLDILPRLITLNRRRFAFHSNKIFSLWDISKCPVPKLTVSLPPSSTAVELTTQPPDLVHMRYVLQHMTLDRALQAVVNVVESGARWFLSTTYPSSTRGNSTRNPNLMMKMESSFYNNDLNLPPFSLPPPVTCSHHGSDNKESPGLMCLYDLSGGSGWDKRGWLDLAKRTRISGRGSRRTNITYV